jgi:UrcA family protein
MNSLTTTVLGTLAACLVVAPGLASAATPESAAPSVTVRYSDLNLGTEQGTEALYARLVSAARAVCGAPDIRDLGALVAAHACERQAVANAVRDVRSPRLSAIYSAHPRHG